MGCLTGRFGLDYLCDDVYAQPVYGYVLFWLFDQGCPVLEAHSERAMICFMALI